MILDPELNTRMGAALQKAYAPEEHQVTGGAELDALCDKGIAGDLYAK